MESPRPVPPLTGDLLEEIFLRIGSPADLARASAACVAFRRLIADPSFLRRYRSIHPPPLLGVLESIGSEFEPAEAPHPSAALAGAVSRAADFSFKDYLPRATRARCYAPHACDVRDGRVLLILTFFLEDDEDEKVLPDLAVCDPLARRFLRLPPVPDDLLASVQFQQKDFDYRGAFLVPSGYQGDGTSFRVIVVASSKQTVIAFVFSSATGYWSAGSPLSWDNAGLRMPYDDTPSFAYGCFYWKVQSENKLVKLTVRSMEFSAVDLPPGHDSSHVIIVEAGESRLGMFSLINNTSLCYRIGQIGGQRFDQLMDSVIPLPVDYFFRIHGSYEGHVFMTGYRFIDDTCFTLEIKTLKIERVCQRLPGRGAYLYFGFPPSMSQRRI